MGQGVYVGAMGSINCGVTVAAGNTGVFVGCIRGVSVKSGRMVGVEVTVEFRLSRPKVRTEPTTRMSSTNARTTMPYYRRVVEPMGSAGGRQ